MGEFVKLYAVALDHLLRDVGNRLDERVRTQAEGDSIVERFIRARGQGGSARTDV